MKREQNDAQMWLPADVASAVRETVNAAEDRLDDVTRARIANSLTARLDEIEAHRSERRSRAAAWRAVLRDTFGGRSLLAAASIGVVVLAAVVMMRHRPLGQEVVIHRGNGTGENSRTAAPARPAVASPLATTPAEQALFEGVDSLQVPAGTAIRARLRDKVRMTLVGPAELVVLVSRPDLIEVALRKGTMLATYEGARGGVFRIRAPDAVVDVVGTLFAVQTREGAATAISVVHGRVAIKSPHARAPVFVSANEAITMDAPEVSVIEASTRERLIAFENTSTSEQPQGPEVARSGEKARLLVAPKTHGIPPVAIAPPVPPVAPSPPVSQNPGARPDVSAQPGPSFAEPLAPEPSVPSEIAPAAPTKPQPLSPAGRSQPQRQAERPAETTVVAPSNEPPRARALYLQAEAAMRRHDSAEVRALLERLVAECPGDSLVDVARYELAQLAVNRRDWTAAIAGFSQVGSHAHEPAVREAAAFAACDTNVVAQRKEEAYACLRAFRGTYPQSVRDAEVLAQLVALASHRGDCRKAVEWADEYAHRYPSGTFSADVATQRQRCH